MAKRKAKNVKRPLHKHHVIKKIKAHIEPLVELPPEQPIPVILPKSTWDKVLNWLEGKA
jgi:hypothetical protein